MINNPDATYAVLDETRYDIWNVQTMRTLVPKTIDRTLVATPPMPLGDGTYFKEAGFYLADTNFFDSLGRPVLRQQTQKLGNVLMHWHNAFAFDGPAGTDRLEARRQQDRLSTQGVAYVFRLTDMCPEGVLATMCPASAASFETATQKAASDYCIGIDEPIWNTFGYDGFSHTCEASNTLCESAIQTQKGVPTGIVRLAYSALPGSELPARQPPNPAYTPTLPGGLARPYRD
jgi:hypothetical protein